MMDWTDRHCRFFLRLFSPRVRLYTEMIVAQAILRGDRARLLAFDPSEHPVALQLGGSDPGMLAEAAAIGSEWGYDEINLNVGCPSDRVQNATFGACLMLRPALVADCVRAMRAAVSVPVTVKCRIGIDDHDSWEFLCEFVAAIADAGCGTVIVHARKAVLKGLSPKQNREVPPLDYERAWRVKREFPALAVIVNGGLRTVPQISEQFAHADGVMLGREAYHNPWLLPALHCAIHNDEFAIPDDRSDRHGDARLRGTSGCDRHAASRHHAPPVRPARWPCRGPCLAARAVRGREPRGRDARAHRGGIARR